MCRWSRSSWNAGYADDEEKAQDLAERFLDVETRIASHHWDKMRKTRYPQATNNPTTFDELKAMFIHFDIERWIKAVQESYDTSHAARTMPVDMLGAFADIIVDAPSPSPPALDGFWAAASLDDLKLWARVHVIIDNASMLSSVFDKTNFSFYGQVLSVHEAAA